MSPKASLYNGLERFIM